MYILEGLFLVFFIFGSIVCIHELGHFIFARFFGVRVHEFGLGLPPRLKKIFIDKKGTFWSLNWLPIGGFVRLKWEDKDDPESKDPDSISQKTIFAQMLIVLAGIFFNLLLAFFILYVFFLLGLKPLGIAPEIIKNPSYLLPTYEKAQEIGYIKNITDGVVLYPMEGTPAYEAGIEAGDILIQIDDIQVSNPKKAQEIIQNSQEIKRSFTVMRGKDLRIIPIQPKEGKIGVYLSTNYIDESFQYQTNFSESFVYAGKEVFNQSKLLLGILGDMIIKGFTGTKEEKQEALNNVWWPVALGHAFINWTKYEVGFSAFVLIGALISINLAIFNLLPFPALDGGRFFILFVNGISSIVLRKRIISDSKEKYIHYIGFVFLILLSILIALKDIYQIF